MSVQSAMMPISSDQCVRASMVTPAMGLSRGSADQVKVKVFYRFQGSETTCLCSLSLHLKDACAPFVQIPLKDCLAAVCASCPDMLLYPGSDSAVYSANFQETGSATDKIVWEGHGLLSWVMDTNNHDLLHVCGKTSQDKSNVYIQVNLQFHPTHRISRDDYYHMLVRRRIPHHSQPSPSNDRPVNVPTPPPEPPSRPVNHFTRFGAPPMAPTYAPAGNNALSVSRHHDHWYAGERCHTNAAVHVLPPITQLSPDKESWSPTEEDADFKRRRLTPPAGVSLPPPSALLGAVTHPPQTETYFNPSRQTRHAALPQPGKPICTINTRIPVGRRKKRDTKPPNANDVRIFMEVEKDKDGNYRLPVEIDSWTVISLGTVVYDRPAFHNQRYIYPVGYKVKKWYRSMVDPHSDTQYTCEILDGNQEPIFSLEADDNPGEVYTGPTPTTVWTIAVRRAFAIRNIDYGHNPVGPDFFGLRKNTIAKMIQDLPNADKCHNYIWQTFQLGTGGRASRGRAPQQPQSLSPP